MPPLQAKGRSTPARSAAVAEWPRHSATGTSRAAVDDQDGERFRAGADWRDSRIRSRLAAAAGEDKRIDMNALGAAMPENSACQILSL